MRIHRLGDLHGLASLVVLLLLVACGGGGGDGGGGAGPTPLIYTGNISAAVVTTTNASKLTDNVIGDSDAAGMIGGVSVESGDATQDPGSGLMNLAQRLNRTLRGTAIRALQANSAQRLAPALQVNDVEPCENDMGSVRTSGTLDDTSVTGTLQVSFDSCLIDGVTLNGPATLRVDHFELAMQRFTDTTLSFPRLTLRGSGLSIDAGGSLRWLLTGTGCCGVGVTFERYTITANLVVLDNGTGKMTKTDNFDVMSEERLTSTATSLTTNLIGKVFDQDHGYVDITTPTPLLFDTLTQLFPNSGQMQLTGDLVPAAGNRRIRVTAVLAPPAALPATLVDLELDLTGSGFPVGKFARLKWTDLAGAVGADLGDNDGDGMHNSWETVNTLNPAVNDAADDKDGDLITNINEYLAGTVP